MADEIDDTDTGNDHVLEGSEDIMSAIDGVLATGANMHKDATDKVPPPDQTQQVETEGAETPEQTAERARDEQGRFTAQQQEAKDRADKAAADANKGAVTDAADKQYPAEIKSPKAREHFDALSKTKQDAVRRAESAEARVKQFETRVQELESRSGTAAPEVKVLQAENAQLKADLDEREKVIAFKAVEETKAFREGVTKPQREALDEINEAAANYKLNGPKLDEILREPNKYKRFEMLADLAEEVPERSKGVVEELRTNINKYVAAEAKANELYSNAKGNQEYADQEQQQTEAKAALERQQAYQKGNKIAEEKLKTNFPELDEEWTEIVGAATKIADFDKLSPERKAGANMMSFMVMPLAKRLRATLKELADLKDVMAKRNGSNLSPAGGRAAAPGKGGADEEYDPNDPGAGLMSSIDQALAGQ